MPGFAAVSGCVLAACISLYGVVWADRDLDGRFCVAAKPTGLPAQELQSYSWLHSPKTGTSFVTVLIHYSCPQIPAGVFRSRIVCLVQWFVIVSCQVSDSDVLTTIVSLGQMRFPSHHARDLILTEKGRLSWSASGPSGRMGSTASNTPS